MAKVNPNFNEEARELIPDGVYPVRILGGEIKQSKQGNPYINWKMAIDEGRFKGRWIFLMTGLSGKGAAVLKELVRVTADPSYESGEIDTDDLVGFPFQVRVSQAFKPDGSPSDFPFVEEILPAAGQQAIGF